MPLKKSHGNMYDWVSRMHSHLGGKCPHECEYCYVQKNRFGVSERYQGKVRIIADELKVNYKNGNTIFIEHMNDMFAVGVSDEMIHQILAHCNQYSGNTYVFQTKNPERAFEFIEEFPKKFMMGTTIESDRDYPISKAPTEKSRFLGIARFSNRGIETFITIEPILDMDVHEMIDWIKSVKPSFVNIGADSKRCNLPEPPNFKIKELVARLQAEKINIKKKVNLTRLLK